MKEENGKKISRQRMTHEEVRIAALKEAEKAVRDRGDRMWDMAPMFAESRDYEAAAKYKNDAIVYYMAADMVKKLMENEAG